MNRINKGLLEGIMQDESPQAIIDAMVAYYRDKSDDAMLAGDTLREEKYDSIVVALSTLTLEDDPLDIDEVSTCERCGQIVIGAELEPCDCDEE